MAKLAKIMIAGEGGQGIQAVAEILAEAAYEEGKHVLYIPNFGVEQRGGVSVAFLQIGDEPIGSPKFEIADIIVALSERAVGRTRQYVGAPTVFVYDTMVATGKVELPTGAAKVLAIPGVETAKKELHPRVFNVMIMGAVIEATKVVSPENAKKAIEKRLGYKFEQDPKLRELNYRAIERGMELVGEVLRGGQG
ncbi:MAG: 2-oxoacid:acceptor oxidoreductase family protein [Eubacteriales bacterium]|jgi:2-oxoglutarate ferredoxin oxidoreductase subunit gamma|nr:2-oxoacid:acceptor oxidoreductase family protein [Bacillota bacterium]MBV1727988.1 2-oxoacid:acceptor oxidoreductase family protein [Desulforudis sp.]MDP3049771.1 2-oxoacid:acceptor oxidoreductase family protein [Eubacteriales bacterium]MDQ7789909.1 2-oxoacid:acceptor oxidoreductase family protein [Clostridia bacterium]MBU4532971.1 2-oxoacid:acceptor oxidoreductase family protein [Bacillota bacterium]